MWEEAYLAMSMLIGESIDEALSSLTPESRARTESLQKRLAHSDRATRAKVIAHTLQPVLRAVAKARVR